MAIKHLEINILSAQDLAPVSKLLRTYAVAWVHPDQKLTTRVDHRGHTNPTWNYRFVFALDDDFLSTSSSSSLNVEIYNVSWLRDIPIGSVHAPIANILPPPSQTNSKMRFVSLHILRPSGTLQGTLNLGVNVVDGSRRSVALDRQLSAPAGSDRDIPVNRSPPRYSKRNYANLEDKDEDEEDEKTGKIRKLGRSQSERTDEESLSKSSSIFSRGFNFRQHKVTTTAPSISSYIMGPLPSEVAASMAKGLYSTPSSWEVGSSVFENWTVVGGGGGVEEVVRTKSVRWKTDDGFTPSSKKNKKKQSSGGGGLLSCFGFLCGYECNIVCGAPKSKKKRTRFGESKVYVNHSVEDLGLLYR